MAFWLRVLYLFSSAPSLLSLVFLLWTSCPFCNYIPGMGFQEALALHVSLLHWHAPALYLKHVLFEGLNCSHGETTYRLSYKFAWDDCSVCQWRSFQHLPFYFNPPLDCLLLASYTTSTFISKNRNHVQAHCKDFPAATLNSTIFSNLPCQPNIIIISSFFFGNFQIISLPYLLIIIHYSAHYTFAQSLLVHSFSCYPLYHRFSRFSNDASTMTW